MTDNARIEDLRRRIQKDPASIAFAQLAEECRRAGQLKEAVAVCRGGLQIHPGYVSARLTLGRALVALKRFEEAQVELERVLDSAPENLAAIRGLADLSHVRGDLSQALAHYRAALALAPDDQDLVRIVRKLSHTMEPPRPPMPPAGPIGGTLNRPSIGRAIRTIAALEQLLAAIHVARAQPSP